MNTLEVILWKFLEDAIYSKDMSPLPRLIKKNRVHGMLTLGLGNILETHE
jgi:hypothetical protein